MTSTPTTPATSLTPTTPAAQNPHRTRQLRPLGQALAPHIAALQNDYLRDKAAARANLAGLRRGLGKPAGSIPEIWAITIGVVPEQLSWQRDEPSRAEHASHAALCLFALHQQSWPGRAHLPGVSFGTAVARLREAESRSADAVTRRFMAVATAVSIDEVLVHIRGLITQLRGIRQGLDYARLADDLLGLLSPSTATPVRLAWGRDYYRVKADNTTPDPDNTTDTTPDSAGSDSASGATDE
jgi:CRISPR system Cascade subunit CasB